MGDLMNARKKTNLAKEAFLQALQTIEKVANELDDDKLRDTFLKSKYVESVSIKIKKC